ncbi:hypothetical protein EYF80_064275 [Liparis tanakae]|uniref:Uncharacterized protein n=1 Tax=Liparis tanakae TaxID=230148 RepID=A0A4Z2EA51_9TELE|nr:hypothetical protein EYF80_064275 [Liparis tanakae]
MRAPSSEDWTTDSEVTPRSRDRDSHPGDRRVTPRQRPHKRSVSGTETSSCHQDSFRTPSSSWRVRQGELSGLTFLQGLEDTSKEALKALLCPVFRMVRGRLGRRGSLLSPLLFPAAGLFSDFTSTSSSSLSSATGTQPSHLRSDRQLLSLLLYWRSEGPSERR